ncbi:unnamed protein product, partial [Staurois parvus]
STVTWGTPFPPSPSTPEPTRLAPIIQGQGRTDNTWGPWAIGDHGAPVFLPKLKKLMKKVPGPSHGAPN